MTPVESLAGIADSTARHDERMTAIIHGRETEVSPYTEGWAYETRRRVKETSASIRIFPSQIQAGQEHL